MNKNYFISHILVFIILFFFIINIVPSSGFEINKEETIPIYTYKKLYVGGSGPDNYTKIQDAIDDASMGDTVFVYNDSSPYKENILIDKSLNLVGEDRETTIIDGSKKFDVLYVAADYVTINNFKIINSKYEEDHIYAGIKCSNILYLRISNNYFSDNMYSIVSLFSENVYIDNNIIKNKPTAYTTWGIKLYKSHYCSIMKNDMQNSNCGICIHTDNADHTIIRNNKISEYTENGMKLRLSDKCTVSDNIISSSYNISAINDGALRIVHSDDNIISNNTITHNPISGIFMNHAYDNFILRNTVMYNNKNQLESGGIHLFGYCEDNDIHFNNILNNYGMAGLFVESHSNTIRNNIIKKNKNYGMIIYRSFNDVYRNIVTNNLKSGIFTLSENEIFYNIVENNSEYGIIAQEGEVYKNHIVNNSKAGILVHFTWELKIKNNNLISNGIPATFECTIYDFGTVWLGNYYGRPNLFPKVITGKKGLGYWDFDINSITFIPLFPWINIDLRPAIIPFNI